jgi:hypothetical protein
MKVKYSKSENYDISLRYLFVNFSLEDVTLCSPSRVFLMCMMCVEIPDIFHLPTIAGLAHTQKKGESRIPFAG